MSATDPSLWDAEAAAFDEAPDHGLLDPRVRSAWRDLLLGVLPAAPAAVVDLGCGTGTLAVLLAEQGYAVDGARLRSRHGATGLRQGGCRAGAGA